MQRGDSARTIVCFPLLKEGFQYELDSLVGINTIDYYHDMRTHFHGSYFPSAHPVVCVVDLFHNSYTPAARINLVSNCLLWIFVYYRGSLLGFFLALGACITPAVHPRGNSSNICHSSPRFLQNSILEWVRQAAVCCIYTHNGIILVCCRGDSLVTQYRMDSIVADKFTEYLVALSQLPVIKPFTSTIPFYSSVDKRLSLMTAAELQKQALPHLVALVFTALCILNVLHRALRSILPRSTTRSKITELSIGSARSSELMDMWLLFLVATWSAAGASVREAQHTLQTNIDAEAELRFETHVMQSFADTLYGPGLALVTGQ